MRLFSAALDLVLVPVAAAADVVMVPARLANGDDLVGYTRKQAERIDDALQGKEPRP
jgi:hypothetical protein